MTLYANIILTESSKNIYLYNMTVKRENSLSLESLIENLQMEGRYTFTSEEAVQKLSCSPNAHKKAAQRLINKGKIISIRKGFFAIIPFEYQAKHFLPPSWYIDSLMKYHNQPYYVGLLSAAALHGAAHQQPQEFHVMTTKPLRAIEKGMNVKFFVNRRINREFTIQMKAPSGYFNVSSAELTTIDLMRYSHASGYLNNIATVISELSEKIDPNALLKAAKFYNELASVQRLGYLLTKSGNRKLAIPLLKWIQRYNPQKIKLDPAKPKMGILDSKWLVIVNHNIEEDL